MRRLSTRQTVMILGVAVVIALGVGVLYSLRGKGKEEGKTAKPGFRECATEAGLTWEMHFLPNEQGEAFKINLYDHGAGVAVGDYDGDGRDDIYFCNQLGPNALYRNKGDGTFEDVTAQAGVALGDRVCVAATFVDYDNDGRQDLFITSTRGGNVLFRNQGDGTFKDVTKEAGLSLVKHCQSAVFFDYDNDGHLDLFVTCTAEWTSNYDPKTHAWTGKGGLGGFGEIIGSAREFNVLYRNNGDGTFTDVTEKAGLKGRGFSGDAVAFDYNDDGRLDLLVTCMFGPSHLYRNNGDGTFTDVTRDVLGRTPWGGMGVKVFDCNNDGRLDVYLVDMHSDMWMGTDWAHHSLPLAQLAEQKKFASPFGPIGDPDPEFLKTLDAAALQFLKLNGADPRDIQQSARGLEEQLGYRPEDVVFGNVFFKNLGGGKFEEISDRAHLETFWPWGIATGDFDNDGYEDIFEPAGMGFPFYYWPNYLLMNNGDETFSNRAREAGVEPPPRGVFQAGDIGGKKAARSSRSAAVADFDGDGRLDLVVNNFNDLPYFFRNQFPRRNYVAFRLRGTKSNRDAIGAVVKLSTGSEMMVRQLHAASGYLSQSSKTLHFGLGDRTKVDRIEILWPSGERQTIEHPALNRVHPVTETGTPRKENP